MPGDFGELMVNIGLVINFLAGGTFYFNSNDTLSYIFGSNAIDHSDGQFLTTMEW